MHISTRSDLIGITLPKMSQVVQEDAYYAIWRAREVLNHSNQLSEGHNGIFIFFRTDVFSTMFSGATIESAPSAR